MDLPIFCSELSPWDDAIWKTPRFVWTNFAIVFSMLYFYQKKKKKEVVFA